jgi:curved DNA-binding protein CbpA
MIKDYYQELHIQSKAVPELINSSYKILKEKYKRDIHPDEIESWMTSLDEAYEVLSNPEKRKKYDQVYFQEFGGVAELEKRLNKHKGVLYALATVFISLIIVAVYFLYTIKKPLPPKGPLTHQIAALKYDLNAFKVDKGKFPNLSTPEALKKALQQYKDERSTHFWGKMKKYELTKSGSYRITFEESGEELIVTPDSTYTK